jgi:tRNA G10  N-methylase Trm11
MKYFFILGTNPALSTAEICSLFPNEKISLAGKETAVLETEKKLIPEELIARLGGTIKIGEILFSEKSLNFDSVLKNLQPQLVQQEAGKFKFGISYYGQKKVNLHGLAMNIKNYWREQNVNSRWVVSKEKVLSSVVVEQNKLISQGIEIIIIENDKEFLIGKTLAVQPFKELSFRDFGRPARDDRSGMIPPKLAQIMINLSAHLTPTPAYRTGRLSSTRRGSAITVPSPILGEGQGEVVILDPFCGSGTILSEAILMGYKNLIGSDNSDKAIADTQTNLKWLENNFNITGAKYRLFKSGAQSIAQKIKAKSVDAIVTEPYLGPQRGNVDPQKIKIELEKLYSESLQQFKKIIKDDGVIVMVWPIFKTNKGDVCLNPNIDNFKIVSPFKKIPSLEGCPAAAGWGGSDNNLTNRNTIIYGRPGQKVWREIVILKQN